MKRYLFYTFLLSVVTMLSGCSAGVKLSSVSAEEFADVIRHGNVHLVDVRTAEEYAAGHIPGAVNMDGSSAEFEQQISTLSKSKPVALYCRSGRRSKIAAERVNALGYDVIELDQGILSWQGELSYPQAE